MGSWKAKVFAWGAVAALLAGCGQAAAPAPSGSSNGSSATGAGQRLIKIGAIVPATGPNAEWGKKNTIALQMLEKEVNAAGGAGGAKLQILIEDSAQKPEQAANLVRKLANDDKVLAIAGPLLSGECEVAFPVANQLHIVTMSQASSKPGVAAANRPWAFRNTMTEDKLAAITMQKFVAQFHPKKVAVLYDSKDATSTALGKAVLPAAAKAAGVEVVEPAITFQTGDTDLSAQVTKLKGLGVDGVLLGADYGPASVVLHEMNRQGVLIPVIGGTPLISTAILQAADKVPVMAPATFWTGIQNPKTQDFIKAFRTAAQQAGIPANDTDPLMYDANIYDDVQIFLAAIKANNLTGDPATLAQDREKIRDYVASLNNFQGIGGTIGFDKAGDGVKQAYILEAKGGSWQELK